MATVSKNTTVEPIWYLRSCELFDSLDADEMREFVERGRLISFSRGEQIYAEGDPGNLVYFIKRGGVKIITSNADGKEIALAYLKELELLGETALVDDAPREQRAIATEDCCLIAFEASHIEELMQRKPELSLSLTKFVGLRLRKLQTRLQHLMFRSPLQRLASLLLELAEDFGEKDPRTGDMEIKLRITHSEIASLIGVTRESVTYAMGQLELDELIRVVKRRIYLSDAEGLSALSR
jgi:CRP-like cAMP-binding protein